MWQESRGDLWTPDVEGDSVEGVIVNQENGEFGRQVIIECEPGKVIKTPAHKVLQQRLECFSVGDRIRIEYCGSKQSKKGNDMHIYKLFEWKE